MDDTWGKGAWVPPFQRRVLQYWTQLAPLTADIVSNWDVELLNSITKLALRHNIRLTSLYEVGGYIYKEVEAATHTSRAAPVDQVADTLLGTSRIAQAAIRQDCEPQDQEAQSASVSGELHGQDDISKEPLSLEPAFGSPELGRRVESDWENAGMESMFDNMAETPPIMWPWTWTRRITIRIRGDVFR